MSDPLSLGLCEAAEAVAAGRLSAEALTEASLAACETRGVALNAVVGVEREAALARARALDAEAQAGRRAGTLHGVPLAHKDVVHRAGVLCEGGAAIRRGFGPSDTADALAALDAAGQAHVARLHMAEFAMGPGGHNAQLGRCLNPWDESRVTGGSSSGSAAAVAARLVFGALGSDTGGSVRLPAALCGVVGLKPTQGLLSCAGMTPLSESLDCPGPLARSARDVGRMMDALTGRDGYEAAAERGVAGLRIGLPRAFYYDDLEAPVAEAMDAARRALEGAGAVIVDVAVPDHAAFSDLATLVFAPEAAARHLDWLRERPQDYGPQVRARLSDGLTVSAAEHLRAKAARAHHLRAMLTGPLAEADALLTPALRMTAPGGAETDVGAGPEMAATVAALAALTRPVNYLGLPAIAAPAGFDPRGCPIGLQLIGRPWDEATLIAAAAAHGAATGMTRLAPPGAGGAA